MFEIKPNKGESYTVNKQHKLVLISSGNTKYKKGEIIEITVENYLKETKDFQNRMKIFSASIYSKKFQLKHSYQFKMISCF